jgi:C4-dicarboxylate-specific signal transduction histidine kinase
VDDSEQGPGNGGPTGEGRLPAPSDSTARLAHDINNQLAALHLLLQNATLQAHALTGARDSVTELLTVLEGARECVASIASLTADLADAPQRAKATTSYVSLPEVARAALRMGAGLWSPPLTIVTELDAVPAVEGHRSRLLHLTFNLLLNAMQALERDDTAAPRIVVRTRSVEQRVVLSVEDNGPGLPRALQSQVFEPYFTTRARSGRNGLGLAICAQIAREHAGALRVDSTPGEGARFELSLPAAPKTAAC